MSRSLNVKISTGGYSSVDRVAALLQNLPIIRKLTLPTYGKSKCQK